MNCDILQDSLNHVSVLKKKWIYSCDYPVEDVEYFCNVWGISRIVSELLSKKGITRHTVENFLQPRLKHEMPSPFVLKDMDRGVERVVLAMERGEKILIFGDYDVDGATSTALLYLFFKRINIFVGYYIPDRQKDGYGLNVGIILAQAKQKGYTLVISVDCGATAWDEVQEILSHGIDVIILDHHPTEKVPPTIMINPRRDEDTSGLHYLAAVGVCFMFLVGLQSHLKKHQWYEKHQRKAVDLLEYLDLVALGTVCDVVPLIHLNRAFVFQGIRIFERQCNVGLAVAKKNLGFDCLEEYHLGFLLGPRINAGGRIGEASLGVRLLTSQTEPQAQLVFEQLDLYNQQRKIIEQEALLEAVQCVETHYSEISKEKILCVYRSHWHQGVIGLLASALKDLYSLPVCVFTQSSPGILKGSGRSVEGINLGKMIADAFQQGILMTGGGHAMAAGLTLAEENYGLFQDFLKFSRGMQEGEVSQETLKVDAIVLDQSLTVDVFEEVRRMSPFGEKNSLPCFVLLDMRLIFTKIIGNLHLQCQFEGLNGSSLKTMSFRAVNGPLAGYLQKNVGDRFNLCGSITINHWKQRKTLQMILKDVQPLR